MGYGERDEGHAYDGLHFLYAAFKYLAAMSLGRIIILVVCFRLLYFAFSLTVDRVDEANLGVENSYDGFVNVFNRNDAGWYEKIAQKGYPKTHSTVEIGYSHKEVYIQSAWAFFPLYPLLVKGVMQVFSVGFGSGALFISLIFSVVAACALYFYARNYFGDDKRASFTCLLWLAFPFDYYFFVFYTEVLYFSFLLLSFLCVARNRRRWLYLLLPALVLVRPNGMAMLLPLFAFELERTDFTILRKKDLKKLFSLSVPYIWAVLFFVAYGFYQRFMTGEFFAFSIAQRGWYREFMFPAMALFRRGDFATQFNSVYTLIFIVYAIFVSRKLTLSMNLLLWISLILPLCSGSVTSMQRFIIVIFPLLLSGAASLYKLKARYVILGASLLLQLWVFYYWLHGAPFSY